MNDIAVINLVTVTVILMAHLKKVIVLVIATAISNMSSP